MDTLDATAHALDAGRTTSRALVEACLARIADPAGEGARAFVTVYAASAREAADAADLLRRAGRAPSPWAGLPFSLKDLFDVAGEATAAGSRVLAGAAPAARHAEAVQRMLGAGLVAVGRTAMTEFAFSGLGLNSHHGTPSSPWDRATGRIPGGSSSGAAVSVADGMALAALGTDTGGSCRIPAALCGAVGFKPTARRVPLRGAFPLAPSLDSIGPLANSVACCAAIDALLAGDAPLPLPAPGVSGLRLAVAQGLVLDGLDPQTAASWEAALRRLEAAGARLAALDIPVFAAIARSHANAVMVTSEAYAVHRERLGVSGELYDPQVRARMQRGEGFGAAEYIDALATRALLCGEMDLLSAPFDAVLMPTVPIVAPAIRALDEPAEYVRVNQLVLRNTALANFLDRCAISVPCHRAGDAPAGLMLVGETMGDRRLLAVAAAVEAALRE
jgi:aspartyl-tRNA(Asn)/glutamyl-tRNA(Gln) amidotransferase subunit A